MDIATEKAEIIRWIETVDNPAILVQINQIRREKYFDFEKEWERVIPIAEARMRSAEFIPSLPWTTSPINK